MTRADVGQTSPTTLRRDKGRPKASSVGGDAGTPVRLNPTAMARFFAVVIAVIIVVGALANYAVYNVAPDPDHPIADVLKRFDLGHEPSIPAFYSSIVMLASAAVLIFLGRYDQSGGTSRKRYWYALGILFVCLAIDEVVMFHEMGTAAMEGLGLAGPFYFSWVVPGMIFATVVALYFLSFVMTLNSRTRNLFILSGIVFISGAVGMELIAGLIFEAAESEEAAIGSVSHVIVQAIEEGLEMAGVAIFLCALIDYANINGLSMTVRNNSVNSVGTNES